MPDELAKMLPPDVSKILLVFFLSFLVGLEREERKGTQETPSFGGVRTYPLIGLIGFAVALLSGQNALGVAIGLGVIGAFLVVSYRHKVESAAGGATSEMSALATYLIGALVYYDRFWTATALAVLSLLLLELKVALESLARRTAPVEIQTFTKFLLLSAVILPVLPNEAFGPYHLNPFKTWLVVVAVSAVSYGSYVIQKATKGKGGVVAAAVLGGAYSSTVTTVVLARRSRAEAKPHLFAGGMLIASGMMFLRLIALLSLFNGALTLALAPSFAVLAACALVGGFALTRIPQGTAGTPGEDYSSKNPLDLGAALMFAAIFVVMLVVTQLAVVYLGRGGVYGLAAIMGVADVDPFIMGLTQAAGTATPVYVASLAILITVASNNLVKGIYAFSFGDRRAGIEGLIALAALALGGLVPILLLSKA